MKGIIRPLLRCAIALLGAALLAASSQAQTGPDAAQPGAATTKHPGTFIDFMAWLAQRGVVADRAASSKAPVLATPDLKGLAVSTQTFAASSSGQTLPVWNFNVRSSRDGHHHSGTMVGTSPFSNPGSTSVATQVIPLIIRTHTLATSLDPTTGILGTVPGEFTSDPTDEQSTCLTAPNNIPLKLLEQSPLFTPASFTFGAVSVGKTQYIDAFMRANFWNVLGSNRSQYHVLLGPVQVLEPIEIDVPANEGLAIDPSVFGLCAPLTVIDLNWIDAYLNGTVLPRVTGQGVNPGTLPLYFVYNVVEAAPVTNLNTCCILGYHAITGHPLPTQTYAIGDFEMTGAFPSSINDSAVLSHELGEWVNDPYTVNEVAPWGNTGQVSGACSNLLEVGDPLTGTEIPPVVGANGFTYDLQELAFYSWFIGAPATGANGWFSDNGTFLTDAGHPCP